MTLKEMLYSRVATDRQRSVRIGSAKVGAVAVKTQFIARDGQPCMPPFWNVEIGPFSVGFGVVDGVHAGMCEVPEDWKLWERLFETDSGMGLGLMVLSERARNGALEA